MPGKEPMTADTFDEDDYAANLVDKEGYSPETAKMLAAKKKESFSAKKIEINLDSLIKDDKTTNLSKKTTMKSSNTYHPKSERSGRKNGIDGRRNERCIER
jgi:hypothetical protein